MEFKEVIKDKIGLRMSDRTIRVLNLLAEGLSIREIALKTKDPENFIIPNKFRYFNPWYKDWYENKIKEINKA
jgi:hypothetical protein